MCIRRPAGFVKNFQDDHYNEANDSRYIFQPHPKVEPLEKIRPATPHMLTIDDVREFPKYEKTWKEIFQIR